MNIVITGAAGFIGSHLSESLLRHDHNVKGIKLPIGTSKKTI
jgi:nucleoside-diphosphate-sugar epimerase